MIPYHRAYRLGLFMSPGGHRKVNRCLMRFLWGLPQGETLVVELRSLPRGRSPQLRLGGNRPWEGGSDAVLSLSRNLCVEV